MAHKVLYGLLLFVGVIGASVLFILPILQPLLGFAGAMIALALSLGVVYALYAWLVMKTGAKPTLQFSQDYGTSNETKQSRLGAFAERFSPLFS